MVDITGIEGQHQYNEAKRDHDLNQDALKRKKKAHLPLEEAHEDAEHNLKKVEATHTAAKTEFDALDSKLKAAREAHETALKNPELVELQRQHASKLSVAEDAHAKFAELHTKAGGTLNPDGTIATPAKTHGDLRVERDVVANAKEQARLNLYHNEPLQQEFEAAGNRLEAAKANLNAAKTPKGNKVDAQAVQDAHREVQLAERDVKIAERARNATPAYKEFDKLNNEKFHLDGVKEATRTEYTGIRDAASRARSEVKAAEDALHASPLHKAAAEAGAVFRDLEGKHGTAKTALARAEATLAGHKTTAAEKLAEVEKNSRGIERAEKHAGLAAQDLKVASKKWRSSKFFTKPLKWGAVGGGLAAVGALAYTALKPSGRSADNGESIQGLKDQMAENDAKLQAMQTMAPQAPMAPSGPIMMTPQGPVMMVPANNNLTQPQYQGPLVNVQNMGMGAPA